MAQHDRARIADKGWRVPRDLRTSGISEMTSMSGRGCGIMRVGFHERVLGHGGVPGKRGPTWNKTLSLVLGLICNLFPKTEWPCGTYRAVHARSYSNPHLRDAETDEPHRESASSADVRNRGSPLD